MPGSPLPLRLASMVKLEHTIFALPFCFMSAIIAAWGIPETRTIFLTLVCMFTARTAAMTFNRLADIDIDKSNPRTSKRELVTGSVSKTQAWTLLFLSVILFVYAANMLNPLAFKLSPLAIAIILGYSYTKRFTALSHLVLGISLAIAPIGAWVAVKGVIGFPSLVLGSAVMLWTAGFDIIYSLQDTEFDKKIGLKSIPAVFGEENALWASRGMHAAMVVLLVWFGNLVGLDYLYVLGVFLVGVFLAWEHSLVSLKDKSRINTAFFTINGLVSILLFVFTILDVML